MYKYLLLTYLTIFAANFLFAKNSDTLRFYYKNDIAKPVQKDSADFYRLILPPDSNVDKDQYRIFEYYNNGKAKMFTTSLTKNNDLILDGNCITFFKNGSRRSVEQYRNGRQTGTATYYYPNNKICEIVKVKDQLYYNDYSYYLALGHSTDNYDFKIIEQRDSVGNILVKNGNGHLIIFDDELKNIVMEGDYKNDKKVGVWKGKIGDTATFTCTFRNNELKNGTTITKSGNRYNFKKFVELADFGDQPDAFDEYVKKNMQLPETAKKRKIYGSVSINFTVETNGTLSNLVVESGLTKTLNEEALRLVRLSPLWEPGRFFGIPMKSRRSVIVRMYRYQ